MSVIVPTVTREEVTHALELALPEWRRHQRCLDGQHCRVTQNDYVDWLLEELLDLDALRPTNTTANVTAANRAAP